MPKTMSTGSAGRDAPAHRAQPYRSLRGATPCSLKRLSNLQDIRSASRKSPVSSPAENKWDPNQKNGSNTAVTARQISRDSSQGRKRDSLSPCFCQGKGIVIRRGTGHHLPCGPLEVRRQQPLRLLLQRRKNDLDVFGAALPDKVVQRRCP